MAAKYDGPAVETSLRGANLQLRAAGIESAALEAELLIAHVLEVDRAHLLAHPEQRLTAAQHLELTSLLERRTTYEPLAYLTGRRW
ncbi:MAG: protein-(glutamine-N5) methyltransferase, release factor-specific, partial [Chloroflexi bacterium]|nr:protein-(glutamine-N5) methyltransferase, release factor-specific [Chloroflexota bacterium]